MEAIRAGARELADGRRGKGRVAWAVTAVAGLVLAAMAPLRAAAVDAPSGCATAAPGQITCAGLVTPGSAAVPASAVRPVSVPASTARAAAPAASLPPGFGPLSLRHAYDLESSALTGGVSQTVAVVTEYGDSTAASDLATYRSEYSLPACGSGCLSVVDENGGTNYPPAGPAGWTLATAQSLDIISAVCPNCHILLVEAGVTSSGSTTVGIDDLGAAENTAVSMGAKFVTNTWFTPEATFGTGEPGLDSQFFDHPGVAITAPDGNGAGFGTYYPAASPDVIAVGGTTLTQNAAAARGWTETAWNGTGSGCSPYEAKPSWQADTGCTDRTLNDVAAVADPSSSPVATFDTASGGWVEGGGNDISAALIAAAFALAGTPAPGGFPASYLYGHTGAGLVNDIASGSDGTCTSAYQCTAGTGYDGPTGVGTPASATALGGAAPDASLTGGPAVADPENGSLNVFGTGTASGTVWRDSWTQSGGWSGWANMSGTLKGLPLSALYDPASGNLEVYGLSTAGAVEEDASADGTTWSGWKSLGGTYGGSPSAVYDPLNDSVDVWEVATSGAAFENSWTAGSGWSGWKPKGGTFSQAGLAPVYDPVHATMLVYGVGNANGTVWGGSYTPAGGFDGWDNMNGNLTGRLSAVYNPLSHNIEIYGQDTANNTEEKYSSDGGETWHGWALLNGAGPTLTHPPVAAYDPLDNSLKVWTGSTPNGTAFDESWTPGGGWTAWQNRNGTLGSGLAPVFDPNSGDLRIFGVGTANGTVWGAALPSSGTWSGWGNMNGTLLTGDM